MVELLDFRRCWAFEGLNEAEVELVTSVVEYRRCPAETVVVESGSNNRCLYIVYSGSVRIVKPDGGAPIAEVLPGQHFGEVSFVDGGVRSATALTNEPSELLVMDPRRFEKLAETHPQVAYRISWSLLRLLCSRLRNTDHWLFALMENRAGATVSV